MKETGVLFKPERIRAIRDDRKTQARRISNLKEILIPEIWTASEIKDHFKCPYGHKGDLLYCRETWAIHPRFKTILYRADGEEYEDAPGYGIWKPSWSPSIHMPKKYARLWLELTADPIPQRLQEITEEDADAECFSGDFPHQVMPELFSPDDFNMSIPECFSRVWESNNGPGTWEINPWVWKLEFKRIER